MGQIRDVSIEFAKSAGGVAKLENAPRKNLVGAPKA